MRRFQQLAARLTFSVLLAAAAAGAVSGALPAAADAPPALVWEQWLHLEGVVDAGEPRTDGTLVVIAAGHLYLVTPAGATAPFAAGSDGYAGPPDAEPYLVAVPPGHPAQAAGCSFTPDDVYILDLSSPPGVTRVDRDGHAVRFATTPPVDGLYGIALDATGRFGYRLLVTGYRGDRTAVFAVDCRGGVELITDAAPIVEGGLVVAPAGFGAYGGDLIAPDELSGQLWAIGPDGTARLVVAPDLPVGGDTGVESLGFVPQDFDAGGAAYLADRGTPGNPFPGSDSLLRLSAPALVAAGVRAGDLLVATEGDGLTVAVRCADTCTWFRVADGPTGGHIEGHIVFGAG